MTSTISIVIPTSGKRPSLLARAINSSSAPGHEVEVIVAVNGPHALDFELPNLEFDGIVRVIRIKEVGVSNARNAGLAAAIGELIRFLDDDDFLVPSKAALQYDFALRNNASAVSGQIRVEDENENSYGTSTPLNTEDIYCELLAAKIVVLPLAHVFRSSAVKHLRWDTSMNNAEDVDWLHRVARDNEQHWLPFNEVVGIWYQHSDHNRLSYVSINNEATMVSSESIMRTHAMLTLAGRSAPERDRAAAQGLWKCAHKAFYLSPFYWSKVVMKSTKLDPGVACASPYQKAARLHIHPLVIDWIMIPKRYLNHYMRMLCRIVCGTSHVRRF